MREPDQAVKTMVEVVENLVIGGGPAGSMAAQCLAAAGRNVVLCEKERAAHDKVCGEFLSSEAIAYLQPAGIDLHALGARAIDQVRFTSGRRTVNARLPFTAMSLSRRVLDETLLKRAQEAGCDIRRGACAERLEKTAGAWRVHLRDARTVEAANVFLATGKHDLSRWERSGGAQGDLVGFKMHWRLSPVQNEALCGAMELFLFRDGYGGLSLIEDEIANLCFVVRRGRLRKLGGWHGLIDAILQELPLLRERLDGAAAQWTKPLAISPIPYGFIANPTDGLWRVGDQAAVIPSFTGDGMSIALHSARLAAEMYLAGRSAEEYVRCLAEQLRASMRIATALSRAMVTGTGRLLAPALLSVLPDAMSRIADWTRIPSDALLASQRFQRTVSTA